MDVQKRLTVEFENIANRILKSTSVELANNSEKTLGVILDPLRRRMQEFQQKIEMIFDAEIRDVLSMKEQIKLIVETSHTIDNQADGLAKALRGDSQLLGKWGELALDVSCQEVVHSVLTKDAEVAEASVIRGTEWTFIRMRA